MGQIISALRRQLRLAGYRLGRVRSERGQTMAEYGILVALIAVAVVAVAVVFGASVTDLFKNSNGHL